MACLLWTRLCDTEDHVKLAAGPQLPCWERHYFSRVLWAKLNSQNRHNSSIILPVLGKTQAEDIINFPTSLLMENCLIILRAARLSMPQFLRSYPENRIPSLHLDLSSSRSMRTFFSINVCSRGGKWLTVALLHSCSHVPGCICRNALLWEQKAQDSITREHFSSKDAAKQD